jgi:mannose-1-phosphate guanylyltransferase
MKRSGEEWAIVLAAGQGTRLSVLTTRGGVATPKQFCSLRGGRSLLGDAIARAAQVVAWDRIVVTVAAEHRAFWKDELAGLPAENVVVQPRNQGTAPGILYPLLTILERDAEARVVVLPSDHYVEKEYVLAVSLRLALEAIEREEEPVVLLGITPDAPETGYGWITSRRHARTLTDGALEKVVSFVEKPPVERARELMGAGGCWNSFLLAARGSTLTALYEAELPRLYGRLKDAVRAPWRKRALLIEAVYERLESADFSRDLLERSEERLSLYRVPACGWTDLGTPERVAACVAELEARLASAPARPAPRLRARFDLASALELWNAGVAMAQPA